MYNNYSTNFLRNCVKEYTVLLRAYFIAYFKSNTVITKNYTLM